MALLRRRYRFDARVRLFTWLLLVQMASFLPFFVVGRYRLGVLALMAPLAGLALHGARRRWRHARLRGRVSMVVAVALCGLVVFAPPPASFHAGPQYFEFGQARQREGDHAEAKKWFARALDERGDYEPALHLLVGLQLADGELDEGEARIDAALELGAKSSRTYELLGRIRHAKGDLEGARTALRQAIDAEPGNTRAWRAYAAVLAELSRFDEARAALESAAALESDPGEAAKLREEAGRIGG
jgi:tetratricopeptide (TPR) repeat protein